MVAIEFAGRGHVKICPNGNGESLVDSKKFPVAFEGWKLWWEKLLLHMVGKSNWTEHHQ